MQSFKNSKIIRIKYGKTAKMKTQPSYDVLMTY